MLKPLDDYLLVRDLDDEEKTSTGIVLPDSARKNLTHRAEVLALGPGRRDKVGVNPMDVKVGDIILYPRGEGEEVGDEKLVQERKILATVEGDKILPYWDKVLVELLDSAETRSSGIILTAPIAQNHERGRVLAVGPGFVTEGRRDKSELVGGEVILFSQYASMELHLSVMDTRRVFITRDNEILAVVEENNDDAA